MLNEILARHQSDKSTHHNYGTTYERLLASRRQSATNILELGVMHGCSLRAWREYFPNATIWGMDNNADMLTKITDRDRLMLLHADTRDRDAFMKIASSLPEMDFICDDCGHVQVEQVWALAVLWPRLKSGGIYIVEDIYKPEYLGLFKAFGAELLDLRRVGGCADDLMAVVRK